MPMVPLELHISGGVVDLYLVMEKPIQLVGMTVHLLVKNGRDGVLVQSTLEMWQPMVLLR